MTWTSDNNSILSFLEKDCHFKKFKIVTLTGDASNRKYFRIFVEDESASTNYVLMAWEPFDREHFPFFNVLQHFKKHNVQVPDVLEFNEKLGLVLLEDLGDLTLEQVFQNAKNHSDFKIYYDEAINELLKIHFSASADRSRCVAFDLAFDVEKLSWELNFTRTHLFEGLMNYKFTARESEIYQSSILQICEKLNSQPKYIQHRDYHSRNLMIKDKKLRVIDFQDARMGAIQYDLVSLFKDSYVSFPSELEDSYLKEYFQEARKFQYPISSYEEFIAIYQVQAIQRCLKACGSFASFYVLKKDDRYLKYLPATLMKVRSLLSQNPDLKEFENLIEHTGVYQCGR